MERKIEGNVPRRINKRQKHKLNSGFSCSQVKICLAVRLKYKNQSSITHLILFIR